jgi:hypothetical protein
MRICVETKEARRWVKARGDGSDLVYEDHLVENGIEAEVEGAWTFRMHYSG